MCGISGFVDFNKRSSEDILKEMSDSMFHRGPDASGYQLFETSFAQVGIAHRRLSIIDLSERAAQPMQFEHLWITFNGEIYNYKEIRKELENAGHVFLSNSDTEVILHSFSAWGKQCVHKFIGMFSFVIYDELKNNVYLCRDRAGVKPLYYYYHDKLFLFASELKAFHKHPSFKKQINLDALATYMQFGNVPAPLSIFSNTFKLNPGHFLTLDATSFEIKQECYWNVYTDAYKQPTLNISFEEAKKKTEEILANSFEYRMVSDVPVGMFLSSGYDSVCVASLLQKNRAQKIKTFTVAVPDIGLNEAKPAREIADQLGTDHHEFACTEKETFDIIRDHAYYYDEPFADSSSIPTTLISKLAKQHVTVALSGDGGDETFAGYNRYDYLMKYGGLINSTPFAVRKMAAGLLRLIPADKIPGLKNLSNFSNRYNKLTSVLSDASPENMLINLSTHFTEKELNELFRQKVKVYKENFFSKEFENESHTPLAVMMAIDYRTYLSDDILHKVDRASMSASLEVREPFLDHRIIEWAATLPDDFKYHNGTKKFILREIVHDYISKDLMNRPKMGFGIPLAKWLHGYLKDEVLFYFEKEKIISQGIFNSEAVEKLKQQFFDNKKKEYTNAIWHLYVFQLWYYKWMS